MIIVNGRNRHTVFPHVASLLMSPKTSISGKDFQAANAPVCISLHRPDEIAASWPGFMASPGLVMKDIITTVGTLGLQGRLFRFIAAIDETGRGTLDFAPNLILQAARSSFGTKTLNMSICIPESLPDLRTAANGSLLATAGFLHALICEDCNLFVGSATYVINDLFENKEDLAGGLGQLANLPRADNPSPYELGARPTQMLADVDVKTFIEDCRLMIDDGVSVGLRSGWLRRTAWPVLKSSEHCSLTVKPRDELVREAIEIAQQCESPDWQRVAQAYVEGFKGWA